MIKYRYPCIVSIYYVFIIPAQKYFDLNIKLILLAFWTNPIEVDSWCKSLSTQQDQIIPPEHESTGLPPANTHDILKPHSNRLPLYLHVCGITTSGYKIIQLKWLFEIYWPLRWKKSVEKKENLSYIILYGLETNWISFSIQK